MSNWLFLDNEMGGTEKEKYSLLTAHFLLTDQNFEKISEFSLCVKPDDLIYKVSGEAMNVNRIDLKVHDTKSITYREAGRALYNWLDISTNSGKNKCRVVGIGIHGDVDWITYHLISRNSWEKFTFYQKIELSSIIQFLTDCGIIKDISGSLESLIKYFNIPFDENQLHNAKYDTEKTRDVYKALVKLGKETVDVY